LEDAQRVISEYGKHLENGDLDDDMISVISQQIPMLNKQKPLVPNVVDAQVLLESEQNAILLEEQMKLIDRTQDLQVFSGPNEKPKDSLDIKKQAQLGSGAQGDVYKVRIKGMRGNYVDKMRKVYNNK